MEKAEKKIVYFIHKNGRKIMVDKKEWEMSWLKWWERCRRQEEEARV